MTHEERPTLLLHYDNDELGCDAAATEPLDVVILDHAEGKVIRLHVDTETSSQELIEQLNSFEAMLAEE